MYQDFISCLDAGPKIKISLAYHLMSNADLEPSKIIFLVRNVLKTTTSGELRVASIRLLDKLEDKVIFDSNTKESNINTKMVYDYYQISTKFRELIKDSSSKFLDFWNTYKKGDPNMKVLLLLNDTLDTISTEV